MAEAKLDKAALVKLLTAAQEQHSKLGAALEEIDRLLAGGAGLAGMMKQFETAWLATWSSRYHGEYQFHAKRDRPQIKRLVLKMTPEELQVRAYNYVRNDDPFFVRARHSFGAFVSTINQHAPIVSASEELQLEAPTGCRHTPACSSDVEHTRRRGEEMRA